MTANGSQLVGHQIGDYTLTKHLGDGGMGSIFLAQKSASEDTFALKLLLREFASDEEFRQRFVREAAVMRQLQHPNIIPVYDSGEDQGFLFFVMHWVRGMSLYELGLKRRFSPVAAYQILNPIASALDYAHDRGVIHRDIKPGNIMIEITNDGTNTQNQVFLMDFGLSKVMTWTGITRTGMSVGTPQYMSPEQVLDETLTPASDVYSLAIVVYEMLLGRLPFIAKKPEQIAMMQIEQTPPQPTQLNSQFPKALEMVLLKALDKKAAERYPKATDFARDFSEAARVLTPDERKTEYWVGAPSKQ